MEPDDLVSTVEIGERSGVSPKAARDGLRRTATAPKPVAVLAIGHLFLWSEIEESGDRAA